MVPFHTTPAHGKHSGVIPLRRSELDPKERVNLRIAKGPLLSSAHTAALSVHYSDPDPNTGITLSLHRACLPIVLEGLRICTSKLINYITLSLSLSLSDKLLFCCMAVIFIRSETHHVGQHTCSDK